MSTFRCCCCSSCIPHFDVFQIKTRRPSMLLLPLPSLSSRVFPNHNLLAFLLPKQQQQQQKRWTFAIKCSSSRLHCRQHLPPFPLSPRYPWQAKRGCGSARNIQFSCFAQHAIHAFADDIQERQTQRVKEWEKERRGKVELERVLVLFWTVSENLLRIVLAELHKIL